jgi:hypothetical protein
MTMTLVVISFDTSISFRHSGFKLDLHLQLVDIKNKKLIFKLPCGMAQDMPYSNWPCWCGLYRGYGYEPLRHRGTKTLYRMQYVYGRLLGCTQSRGIAVASTADRRSQWCSYCARPLSSL